jgi:hypothetical protein
LGIFGKGKKKSGGGAEAPQQAAAAAAAPVAPAAPSSNFATFESMDDYVATLPGPSMTDVSKQKVEDSEAA